MVDDVVMCQLYASLFRSMMCALFTGPLLLFTNDTDHGYDNRNDKDNDNNNDNGNDQ